MSNVRVTEVERTVTEGLPTVAYAVESDHDSTQVWVGESRGQFGWIVYDPSGQQVASGVPCPVTLIRNTMAVWESFMGASC